MSDRGQDGFHRFVMLWTAIAVLANAVCSGCTRGFWRVQADRAVYRLLAEKTDDLRWRAPRVGLVPDPRSRLFDPFDPDREPLPPDDPAAHRSMHWLAGMRGSRSWHKFGQAISIENPHWLAPFGLTPQQPQPSDDDDAQPPPAGLPPLPPNGESESLHGPVTPAAHYEEEPVQSADGGQSPPVGYGEKNNADEKDEQKTNVYGINNLTVQQALELSYIHSREYQTEIENLYLAALDLTFDRFQFNVRYLGIGGRKPSADITHESVPREQYSLETNERFGLSRLLPAGGQIAIELANNTIWLFAGPNDSMTASVLSYSLVQPLLLGAGRKIVLEDLTQSERNVLYAARDLGRFRKQFFSDTVASGPGGGFLGILQQIQVVANRRGNIRQLQQQVELLRTVTSQRPEEISENLPALPPGLQIPQQLAGQLRYGADQQLLYWRGEMTVEQENILTELSDDPAFRAAAGELIQRLRIETVTLDVAQLETQLANSRNTLRQSERQLQDALDQFKIQLGLPPDFQLNIDDSLLEQFTLIDERLFGIEDRVDQFVSVWAQLDEENPQIDQLRKVVTGLEELQVSVQKNGMELIEADFLKVREHLPERISRLKTEQERDNVRSNIQRDQRLYSSITKDFQSVADRLTKLSSSVKNDDLSVEQRRESTRMLAEIREDLLKIAKSLQVIQAGLRAELISLQPFRMGLQEAVCNGLENRLDLMNFRAFVMDARRREEIAANQLQAVLDIVVQGDIRTRTDGKHPFDFRGRRSSFRVGARFTAPLDQISERNAYRAALIDYQRSRRAYMSMEDQVKFSIRQGWRQLQVLEENFEITRQALRLSALQLDSAVEDSSAPVQPGQSRQSGLQGRNLLNALRDLLQAQNSLIGIWVAYETNRINIYRDMSIMEIDSKGVWSDRFYQQQDDDRLQDDEKQNGSETDDEVTNGRRNVELGRPAISDFGSGPVQARRSNRDEGRVWVGRVAEP